MKRIIIFVIFNIGILTALIFFFNATNTTIIAQKNINDMQIQYPEDAIEKDIVLNITNDNQNFYINNSQVGPEN